MNWAGGKTPRTHSNYSLQEFTSFSHMHRYNLKPNEVTLLSSQNSFHIIYQIYIYISCVIQVRFKQYCLGLRKWITKKWEWRVKRMVAKQYQTSYATLTPLGRFPSMASFLLQQSEQRKGPCQGFELVEKIEPAWTDMPSLGARSTWHTAHINSPDVVDCAVHSSLPSLQQI